MVPVHLPLGAPDWNQIGGIISFTSNFFEGSLVGGIQGHKEGNPQTTNSSQSTHKPLPRAPSSTLKPAFQLESMIDGAMDCQTAIDSITVPMNMEEVLEDSPMFRKKIIDAESVCFRHNHCRPLPTVTEWAQRIEELGNQLKNIIKASTHCTQTGHSM